MENLKGNLTSILTGILLPLMGMLGVGEVTQSYVIALMSGIVLLILFFCDLYYKSDFFTKEDNAVKETESKIKTENTDATNQINNLTYSNCGCAKKNIANDSESCEAEENEGA